MQRKKDAEFLHDMFNDGKECIVYHQEVGSILIYGQIYDIGIHRIYYGSGSSTKLCTTTASHSYGADKEKDETTDRAFNELCGTLCVVERDIVCSINFNRSVNTSKKNTHTIAFTIVQSASPYNIIFGRSIMKKFGAILLTIHGTVQFRTPN